MEVLHPGLVAPEGEVRPVEPGQGPLHAEGRRVVLVAHHLVQPVGVEVRLLARGVRFFATILCIALLYSLGRYTPFFSLAFDWIPGVSLYRRPADATFILNIGLAFGAGYLLHR